MSSLLCNEYSVFSLLSCLPETFLHLPCPQKTNLSAWPSVGTVGTKQLLLSNVSRCIIPGMWEILQANISWCTGLNQRHHLHVQPYRKALCWGQTPTDPSHLISCLPEMHSSSTETSAPATEKHKGTGGNIRACEMPSLPSSFQKDFLLQCCCSGGFIQRL